MKPKAKQARSQSKNGQTSVDENKRGLMTKRLEVIADLRETALAKLDIDPAELAAVPPIGEVFENAEGGLPAVIAAMRFSDNANVHAFLEAWDAAAPADRKIVPVEAFCLLAKVDVTDLVGAVILALMQQNANIVKIIAVTSHPATMRARVRNALKPGGYRDRNAIDTALRFLPQPKGSTTFINVPGGAIVQDQSVGPEDVDTDDLFPDLAITQKMLTEG